MQQVLMGLVALGLAGCGLVADRIVREYDPADFEIQDEDRVEDFLYPATSTARWEYVCQLEGPESATFSLRRAVLRRTADEAQFSWDLNQAPINPGIDPASVGGAVRRNDDGSVSMGGRYDAMRFFPDGRVEGNRGFRLLGMERVASGYGVMPCAKFQSSVSLNWGAKPMVTRVTRWYAKRIGLVKEVQEHHAFGHSARTTILLSAFRP